MFLCFCDLLIFVGGGVVAVVAVCWCFCSMSLLLLCCFFVAAVLVPVCF